MSPHGHHSNQVGVTGWDTCGEETEIEKWRVREKMRKERECERGGCMNKAWPKKKEAADKLSSPGGSLCSICIQNWTETVLHLTIYLNITKYICHRMTERNTQNITFPTGRSAEVCYKATVAKFMICHYNLGNSYWTSWSGVEFH